ncbi:MAG: nucleotidyltransferase domain-containing protein [Nanoarchaeota archaeon]|nr:nucleotidyltransferase domain-containing protein [Nanoarchaeota archaeon]MBU1321537.1 nucleotidyltransferase domain-containing protein [Nanoarchaeota archaeon]MBU1597153.1 nucleotidyltransferase domain-containing protein [Nanoarchaeota archaeon]MBU2441162.1 nucleotidyltransferase domain-containing protein [Nanoarchaeota archaeon]
MGLPSKEERILELFFNEPSRQWHFKDIVKTASISEPAANKWLNKLLKESIIHRTKPKDKMPYFQGNFRQENYRNKKKIYAMQKMYETGLLMKLQQLRNARVIVIFGSFARSDWNTQSDVDIFVLGDSEDLRFGTLWRGLGFQGKAREIQVHSYKSVQDTRKIHSGLMKNVVKGYFVKGNIFDIAEVKA